MTPAGNRRGALGARPSSPGQGQSRLATTRGMLLTPRQCAALVLIALCLLGVFVARSRTEVIAVAATVLLVLTAGIVHFARTWAVSARPATVPPISDRAGGEQGSQEPGA